VEFARDPEPFAELNEGWLKRLATGAPFVTAKLGLSLDAHEAFRTGERSSITGVSGARVTRLLRAASDAVVVSAATVIADNPALTVRDADGQLAERQPLRVVLVRDTMPPESAAVFTDGLAETSVLTCGGALRGQDSFAGAAIVRSDDGDLSDVFGVLGRLGLGEVLLEPGPRLFTALWEVGALDQLVTVTCAGCAGAGAPALFSGAPDCEGNSLVSRMKPVEAGIVLDVSVTAWRPLTPTREP
jgi:diaminohydroxyphosphoribosylaminopyrimidine deaminase/5-amino-6-(5-phosphoribosylamino)uracil reductase